MQNFDIKELNELLVNCAEQGITIKEYIVKVCKLRRPDFNDEIKRCIKEDEIDTLKKYIAVGMIVRFKKAIHVWVDGSTYLEMRKETQLALINYFIEKGEYALADRMTTEKVYPLLERLDDKAMKYLFRDYGDGIVLFSQYDSCIMALPEEEQEMVINLHICGLERLKALYERLKSDGFKFGLKNRQYDEEGRVCDENAYVTLTRADGTKNKILPEAIYNRKELMWVYDDKTRNRIRTLQYEIENIINYYC